MKWSALRSRTQKRGYLPALAGWGTEGSAGSERAGRNVKTMQHFRATQNSAIHQMEASFNVFLSN